MSSPDQPSPFRCGLLTAWSLDIPRAGHREPRRLFNQVPQQRRLADPDLAPHHRDSALAAAYVRDELSYDGQLIGPGRPHWCYV